MPRHSTKKPTAAPVAKITETDAMAVWQAAGGKGLADATAAATMAEALNVLIGHRSWEVERTRRYADHADAIRATLRVLDALEAEIVAAANVSATAKELAALPPLTRPLADRLREDLPRLLAILAPSATGSPPWAGCAGAAWFVAIHAGAPPSPARTALATRFAALAAARCGYPEPTAAAVSLALRRAGIGQEFPGEIVSSHSDAETDTPGDAKQDGGKR